jgi:carbamate kinase
LRIVIALGGNALLQRHETPDEDRQRRNVAAAAEAVAGIARAHSVVITHGNGPQVGLLALQAESFDPAHAHALDLLGAQTEGMIGYLIEQELRNRLSGREVASLLTQVVVEAGDPAFARPTKPIGPVYSKERAVQLAKERGWAVAADGAAYRRVVASPEPKRIVEIGTIRMLLEAGVVVVCTGGGGIPVSITPTGGLRGVDGVIDKDLAAALLAAELGADVLLLLTDVDAVYADWPEPADQPLRETTPRGLRGLELDAGSMGPKAEAVCRFVDRTGGLAGIGRIEDAEPLLAGSSGTVVRPDPGC